MDAGAGLWYYCGVHDFVDAVATDCGCADCGYDFGERINFHFDDYYSNGFEGDLNQLLRLCQRLPRTTKTTS